MSKFMSKLENILMGEGLTQNTASQYVRRVMLLNRGNKFTSIAFLRKPKDILEYMSDEKKLSATSIESYLGMIISILGKMPSKMNDKARKEYEAILNEPNEYFKKRERGKKTENQKKGWVDKETFEKYIEEAKEKGLTASRKKQNFTTKDYNAVLEYFLVSLYTLLPPRRNKDYQLMKVDTEEGNRLDTKTKQFIYTDYKTSGKYGEQKIDLNEYPEFLKVLKIYMKRRPNDSDDLLVFHDGKGFTQTNTITRLLNKIFGGNKVGSTAIRSMYLTSKYGGDKNKEMLKDSEAMGHSIQTQQTSYVK